MKKASRLWHHKGRITQDNQSQRHQPAHFVVTSPRLVVFLEIKRRRSTWCRTSLKKGDYFQML